MLVLFKKEQQFGAFFHEKGNLIKIFSDNKVISEIGSEIKPGFLVNIDEKNNFCNLVLKLNEGSRIRKIELPPWNSMLVDSINIKLNSIDDYKWYYNEYIGLLGLFFKINDKVDYWLKLKNHLFWFGYDKNNILISVVFQGILFDEDSIKEANWLNDLK